MHGVLEEVSDDLGDKVEIGSVNVMQNYGLAGQFGIMGTPTLMMFKDGKVAWQQVGALQKDKLMEKIEPVLSS